VNDNAIGARWAIEALRNGVPNRHAVALLGTFQQRIEERFRQQALETAVSPGTRGFLVRADFGAGKSHLLYALQQIASDLSFATATLAVSKETPLSSFPRTARTILRQLRLPDMEGTGLPAAATRAKFQSEDWLDLQTWADGLEFGGGWWGATLALYASLRAQHELSDRVVRFWGGDNNLTARDLRNELHQRGVSGIQQLGPRPAAGELDYQRLAFASRFVQGLGFKGLVVFLDEVELIAQYPRQQRIQAYRNLAALLGQTDRPELAEAALLVVGAVTSDFDDAVLRGKEDWEEVPRIADVKYGPEAAEASKAGMEAIRAAIPLATPDEAAIARIREVVTDIYRQAYAGWTPPPADHITLYASTRMRELIRRWITSWDLQRYYEGPAEIEVEDIGSTPTDESEELTAGEEGGASDSGR
jgi:hypothetical protein